MIADNEYIYWIADLQQRYRQSQIKAAVRVNSTLLEFYWQLGRDIVELQAESRWGAKLLETLSTDLKREFPKDKGFSLTNLKYIRKWYLFYRNQMVRMPQIGQQVVDQLQVTDIEDVAIDLESAKSQSISEKLTYFNKQIAFPPDFGKIPWGQHIDIITKCKDKDKALFYLRKTIDNGWSRSALNNAIDADFYGKYGNAITNFSDTLPQPQAMLAQELLKDPYNFDFLALTENYDERQLEDALASKVTDFLLELGNGFAYCGRQVEVLVNGRPIRIDMLFYHTRLKFYMVVELKTVAFEPEFAGKLNFYVSAVDEYIKQDDDRPTIGLLICRDKDDTFVKFAFRNMQSPLGVATYELNNILPAELQSKLPTAEEIMYGIK